MREGQYGLRMVFDSSRNAIYNACVAAGMDPAAAKDKVDNAVIGQSDIVLEQAIVAGQSIYTFPILSNTGTVNATEIRLALQDAFYACNFQLLLGVGTSQTDPAYKSYSYPSPTVFTAGEVTALNALYNGKMAITVNNSVIVPSWSLLKHLLIPQTQLTAATNSPVDQFDGSDYGCFVMQPNIVFIGTKQISIQLVLPAAISSILANSKIVLRFGGVLAQNVTNVS